MEPRPSLPESTYVLVLNWRGWKDTIECLESLFRQTYPRFRVIVCDNASENGSLDYIRAWAEGVFEPEPTGHSLEPLTRPPVAKPIRYVEYDYAQAVAGGSAADSDAPLVLIQNGGNLGFAGGTNVGLRYVLARADAEFVWLLNNDTVVDPRALEALIGTARSNPRVGMVGSKLLYFDTPDVIQTAGGGDLIRWQGRTRFLGWNERDQGQWDRALDLDYVTGASLLVCRRLLDEVGLMDERYFLYSEEVDWCIRARRAGWRLVYAPESRVWHREGRSLGEISPLRDYYGVRNSLLLVQRFFSHLLPLTLLYSLYRHALPKLVRGQPARLRAVLRAYRDFFRQVQGPIEGNP